MKKIPIALFGLLIVLAACNKDQKTNNKLDGSWKVVSYNDSEEGFGFFNEDSLVTIDEVQSMEFFACKQKDDVCNGVLSGNTRDTIVNQVIGLAYSFTYKVEDEKLNIEVAADTSGTQSISWSISEMKNGKLTLESDGNKLKLEQTFDR